MKTIDKQKELKRYKRHLEALECDESYNNYEDKRASLREFYQGKIRTLEKELQTQTQNDNRS